MQARCECKRGRQEYGVRPSGDFISGASHVQQYVSNFVTLADIKGAETGTRKLVIKWEAPVPRAIVSVSSITTPRRVSKRCACCFIR